MPKSLPPIPVPQEDSEDLQDIHARFETWYKDQAEKGTKAYPKVHGHPVEDPFKRHELTLARYHFPTIHTSWTRFYRHVLESRGQI